MSAPAPKPSPTEILSKIFGVDVAAMNDGHGLACPCPKHRAEAQEKARRVAREGFPRGSIGALLEEQASAAVGREVLAGCASVASDRIAPGWGCCRCRTYNGAQRGCCCARGHERCLPQEPRP